MRFKSQNAWAVCVVGSACLCVYFFAYSEDRGDRSLYPTNRYSVLESTDSDGLLLSAIESTSMRAPKDLSKIFDTVHSDPDVKPVKGAFKTLSAIQKLGHLPDLSLSPNRKRASPVERVARYRSHSHGVDG